jgi:hypothetical protein
MKKAAVLFLFPLLSHCASNRSGDPGIEMTAFNQAPAATSTAGAKIPVLHSPALDRHWGRPEIKVLPSGGYSLFYTDPKSRFETLTIYGQPGILNTDADTPPAATAIGFDRKHQPTPVKDAQPWKTVIILGRPTHYYTLTAGDGADAPEVSTITFPRGGASYRLTATSNREDFTRAVEAYLKTADFFPSL